MHGIQSYPLDTSPLQFNVSVAYRRARRFTSRHCDAISTYVTDVRIFVRVMALELILYAISRNVCVTEVICFVQVQSACLCNNLVFVLSHLIHHIRRFVLVDGKFRDTVACSHISKRATHCQSCSRIHILLMLKLKRKSMFLELVVQYSVRSR